MVMHGLFAMTFTNASVTLASSPSSLGAEGHCLNSLRVRYTFPPVVDSPPPPFSICYNTPPSNLFSGVWLGLFFNDMA